MTYSNQNKKWSKESEHFLSMNFGVLDIREISEHLGRSPQAIISRTRLMGLDIKECFEHYDMSDIAYIIGKDRSCIESYVEKGYLKVIRMQTLKQVKQLRKVIKEEDLIDFMVKYPQYVNWNNIERIDKYFLLEELNNRIKKRKKFNKEPIVKEWTTKEIEDLKTMKKNGYKAIEISNRLNRSVSSIYTKWYKISLE